MKTQHNERMTDNNQGLIFGYLDPQKIQVAISYEYLGHARTMTPPKDADVIETRHFFMLTPGEEHTMRKVLSEALNISPEQAEPRDYIKVVGIDDVQRQIPDAPIRLGRSATTDLESSADVLTKQLAALKPSGSACNILILPGFGTGYGDSLVGLTAFRSALASLANRFSNINIDVVLSNSYRVGLIDMYRHFGIQPLVIGPSLEEFVEYDAFFDFNNLTFLPKYNDLPYIDWYLWWLGLDTDKITDKAKQNQLPVPVLAMDLATIWLQRQASKQYVFLHTQASDPLRTMPTKIADKIIQQIIKKYPDMVIVVTSPVAVKSAQILDLSTQLKESASELMAATFQAVVASCDYFIGVDSFGQHIANAFAIPSLVFLSSYDKNRYLYYKSHTFITLPKAKSLFYFNKPKSANLEEWMQHEEAYQQAWHKLNVNKVLVNFFNQHITKST